MDYSDDREDKFIQLMRRAQNGDHAAYSELFHAITPLIRGFIYNRIGNGADHDDILQEALLGIHRASHTYNTDRPFTNWMFAIADHKVKDYLRAHYRRKALKEVDFENIEDFIAAPVTSEAPPSEVLNELLDKLPEKQRRIVYMMKIEGYSAQQVAKTMDMSVSNVKVTAHRAYKILIANGQKKKEA
ncbi:MAG: RNA polymerase subunit sigma-24 [Alphaproteobacteria bacterium CG11_big_fil_rev_8_21_14_0_20_39_49]|nr:MAG: RNA polymerase subunit sigma-24 [Alphaproteobacteria bacterium CG11_big_fil_rev_8_21_14_0_20_39_49]